MDKPLQNYNRRSANKQTSGTRKQQEAKSSADPAAIRERLAVELIKQGKLQEAEAIYRQLITTGEANHIAFGNLATICGMQGRLEMSIALNQKALELNPNSPTAHYNLGNALKRKGDFATAIAAYKKALELKDSDPDIHINLGHALQEQGNFPAAINSYKKALKYNPNSPQVHSSLGATLQRMGDLKAAISAYNNALRLKPDHEDALLNLGTALREQGELYPALSLLKKALEINPNFPEAHYNLGNTLRDQGNITGAIESYNKALQLNPNYPEANWNLSLLMLLCGDYKNGWEKYEWRSKLKEKPSNPHASPNCKAWNGEVLEEQTKLLLVSEQGLGDTLQFMRYALFLREQGIDISLCAPPKLHSLIQTSGIDPAPLTPQQANHINEGMWTSLLSVPRHLKVTPNHPIITEPYVKPSKELKDKWASLLSGEARPLIGINWRGNRKDTNKQSRNIPPNMLSEAIQASSGSFLLLQRGASPSEINEIAPNIEITPQQEEISRIADSDDKEDLLEYAAIIANCNLVLTTGTSVAHISAGMGLPTWVFLPMTPDWRWGLEKDTTFWYPSARLFRQKNRGDWDDVMQRLTKKLKAH